VGHFGEENIMLLLPEMEHGSSVDVRVQKEKSRFAVFPLGITRPDP
jgi:hypothetical protein